MLSGDVWGLSQNPISAIFRNYKSTKQALQHKTHAMFFFFFFETKASSRLPRNSRDFTKFFFLLFCVLRAQATQ